MRTRAGLAGLLAVGALSLGALTSPAAAEPAVAVTPGNVLWVFDTSSPGTITDTSVVTGLGANETVRGIDVRPADGQVYITTVTTGSAVGSRLMTYTVNPNTGVATFVGASASSVTNAGDVPAGWDARPTLDTFRYVNTNDENAQVIPSNGLASNEQDLTPAATSTIIGAAHDRNRPGAGATTQYCVDRNDSQLCIQGSIDGAPQSPSAGGIIDLAPLGFTLNAANDGGFDVSPIGNAYAALTNAADNLTRLYTITLVTGLSVQPTAAPVGFIGNGQTEVRSLAILAADSDSDGVLNSGDNCPFTANPDQANLDGDSQGDACDDDDDNDGIPDAGESALGLDPRSGDSDGDGVPDGSDACPKLAEATANGCPPPGPLQFTIRGFPSRIKVRTLTKSGVSLRVEPNAAASFLAELRGRAKGAGLARAGDVVLAETRLPSAAGRRTIRLKVAKSQRRRLRKGKRLTLQVAATDALGRTALLTRRLTLR